MTETLPHNAGHNVTQSGDRYSIEGVLAQNIALAWPFAWPMLEPSIDTIAEEDRPYPQDIAESLVEGVRQLWICWDREEKECVAAVITEINWWPEENGDRVCHVWAAGGRDFRNYAGIGLKTLRAWAAAHGCAMIIHGGRKGWQRIAGTMQIGKRDGGFPVFGRPVSVN